jgi:hypothetical protein
LQVRTGLHTGECELIGDSIGGIAVHIGARVVAAANPDEVMVSSTVKDLVAGSGIKFPRSWPAHPEGRSRGMALVRRAVGSNHRSGEGPIAYSRVAVLQSCGRQAVVLSSVVLKFGHDHANGSQPPPTRKNRRSALIRLHGRMNAEPRGNQVKLYTFWRSKVAFRVRIALNLKGPILLGKNL